MYTLLPPKAANAAAEWSVVAWNVTKGDALPVSFLDNCRKTRQISSYRETGVSMAQTTAMRLSGWTGADYPNPGPATPAKSFTNSLGSTATFPGVYWGRAGTSMCALNGANKWVSCTAGTAGCVEKLTHQALLDFREQWVNATAAVHARADAHVAALTASGAPTGVEYFKGAAMSLQVIDRNAAQSNPPAGCDYLNLKTVQVYPSNGYYVEQPVRVSRNEYLSASPAWQFDAPLYLMGRQKMTYTGTGASQTNNGATKDSVFPDRLEHFWARGALSYWYGVGREYLDKNEAIYDGKYKVAFAKVPTVDRFVEGWQNPPSTLGNPVFDATGKQISGRPPATSSGRGRPGVMRVLSGTVPLPGYVNDLATILGVPQEVAQAAAGGVLDLGKVLQLNREPVLTATCQSVQTALGKLGTAAQQTGDLSFAHSMGSIWARKYAYTTNYRVGGEPGIGSITSFANDEDPVPFAANLAQRVVRRYFPKGLNKLVTPGNYRLCDMKNGIIGDCAMPIYVGNNPIEQGYKMLGNPPTVAANGYHYCPGDNMMPDLPTNAGVTGIRGRGAHAKIPMDSAINQMVSCVAMASSKDNSIPAKVAQCYKGAKGLFDYINGATTAHLYETAIAAGYAASTNPALGYPRDYAQVELYMPYKYGEGWKYADTGFSLNYFDTKPPYATSTP